MNLRKDNKRYPGVVGWQVVVVLLVLFQEDRCGQLRAFQKFDAAK
jgi:hypothetical protein